MLIFPLAAVGLAAPAAFTFGATSFAPSGEPSGFWRGHVAAYVTGGPVFTQNDDLGWTHTESVEALARGAYAELRLEHYYLFPQHVQYGLARVGYLARPAPTVSGGVTIGYRGVRGPPIEGRQQGVEIAFPLLIDLGTRWWRFEPYYVASAQGVRWNYRIEGEWPIPGRPVVAGWRADAMSLRFRDRTRVDWFTIAAVVGIR